MNRLYAVESTPTATGTNADHRWALAPARVGRVRARRSPAERPPRRRCRSTRGAARVRSGGRRPARASAAARWWWSARPASPRSTRSATRSTRRSATSARRSATALRSRPRRSTSSARSRDSGRGPRTAAASISCSSSAATRSTTRPPISTSPPRSRRPALRIHAGLYADETAAVLPVADPARPRLRVLGRRARARRHGDHPAAADRAALQRQVGDRSGGRPRRPRRGEGRWTWCAATGNALDDARLAQGPARRLRSPTRRGSPAAVPVDRVPAAALRGLAVPVARRLEPADPLQAGPDRARRPLRQQRLAPGVPEAAHQADLGQRAPGRSAHRRAARPASKRGWRASRPASGGSTCRSG